MTTAEVRNRQCEATECGLACLAMAATRLGAETDIAWLREHHPTPTRGATFGDLIDVASSLRLSARAVRLEPENLADLQTPALLHWADRHFVLLEKASGRGIRVFDPRRGTVRIPMSEVRANFTGAALEIGTTPQFQKKASTVSKLALLSLFRWNSTLTAALAQVLVLSVLLNLYVLAAPLYVRFAIDDAAMKGDLNLLGVLALGFGLFALFNASAEAVRALVVQRLSSALNLDMSYRLFHHLMRLPLAWFQKRRLADVFTRFNSLHPIRDVVSSGIIAVLIDGALSFTTVIVMFVFAPTMAAIVVTGVVLSAAARLLAMPLLLRLEMDSLQASIEEQGKRIETIRAIQTIKVMSAEPQRQAVWANRQVESIRGEQRVVLAKTWIKTFQTLIDGIVLVVVVYLSVTSIVAGAMTIGTVYAFLAYRSQFTDRAISMIERLIDWRMLSIHTYRLADVALTEAEPPMEPAAATTGPFRGEIEFRNVAFRYGPADPFILKSVNLVIPAGACTAIVGPSGCGKTTLLKLLAALYAPTQGEIRVDGAPIAVLGMNRVRRSIGIVLQDDVLLAGTIAENVSFFADAPDQAKIWRCLALASIADDVRKMPMQLQTMIGDTGSQFSGGQKQRLLLARALYSEPSILVLDEATSNLDVAREKSVLASLADLQMTRVIVSHRPQTIAVADYVIAYDDGFNISRQGRSNDAQPKRTAADTEDASAAGLS